MSNISYYTEEGLKKLKDELEFLERVERTRISNDIAEARDKGDLSENAEYHAAKEEQSMLELKIAKLKEVVSYARIVDESLLDTSKVLIHSTVRLKNTADNKEFKYTLVADSETNLKEGKLSVKSPIGSGLLGKKVGDVAEIQVPSGVMEFEILEVSRG
ncbi:MAG: transcription elongation factor GreA [Lutibacter sp.]